MIVLEGIKNFLQLINDNWTLIVVILGLLVTLGKKISIYFCKSDEEKIAIAKKKIEETMLKMIGDAEEEYEEWNKAGQLKRAQVVKQIFDENPILYKVIDQTELIKWIDDTIDEALVTLRKIVEENRTKESEVENVN